MSLAIGVELRINVEERCFLRADTYREFATLMEELGYDVTARTRNRSPIQWRGQIDIGDERTIRRLRKILSTVMETAEGCPNKERAIKVFLNVLGLKNSEPELYNRTVQTCGDYRIDRLSKFAGTIGDFLCVLNALQTSSVTYSINVITKHPVDIRQIFTYPQSGHLDLFAIADVSQLPVELKRILMETNIMKQLSLTYTTKFPTPSAQLLPMYRFETDIGTLAGSPEKLSRIVVLKGHARRLMDIITNAHSIYVSQTGDTSRLTFNIQTFNDDIPTSPSTALLEELLDLMGITSATTMEPRQYQIDVLSKVVSALRSYGRATIEVATGGGKTEIAIALVISILNELYRRAYSASGGSITLSDLTTKFPIALVTTTRRDLVQQFALRARQYGVPAVYLYGSELPDDATTVVARGTRYSIYTEPGEHFPPIIAITAMSFYYSLLFILAAFSLVKSYDRPDKVIDEVFSQYDTRTLYEEGKKVAFELIRQNITSYLVGSVPLGMLNEIIMRYGIRYDKRTNTAYDVGFHIFTLFMRNADKLEDVIFEAIADELYNYYTEFNTDVVRTAVVPNIISSIKSLAKSKEGTLLQKARKIGELFSAHVRELLKANGIDVPDDFRVRTDALLARFWLAHLSSNIIQLPSSEKIIDDIIERGEDITKKELSEISKQYDLALSAIAENARTITALVTAKLIFERPPMLIIIDEAHHTPAFSYMLIVSSFPNSAVLGMSATPYRGDKMDELIYGISGDIVAKITSSDLILSGYLTPPVLVQVDYYISQDNPDLYQQYDYVIKLLRSAVNEVELRLKMLPTRSSAEDRAVVEQVKSEILGLLGSLVEQIEFMLLGEKGTRIISYIMGEERTHSEQFANLVRLYMRRRRLSEDDIAMIEQELPPARQHLIRDQARLAETYRRSVKDLAKGVAHAFNLDLNKLVYLRTTESWLRTLVNIAVVIWLLRRAKKSSIVKRIVRPLLGHINFLASMEVPRNAIIYNEERTRHIGYIISELIRLEMYPVVVMSTYVAYAKILYEHIKERGIPVAVVTGRGIKCFDGTNEVCGKHGAIKSRREIYEAVRQGKFKVLIGTTLLDEGIDIPEIRTVFLAYSFRSVVGSKQRIGRGLRKAPEKSFLFVIDIVDHLVRTTPSYCRMWWYCTEPLWLRITTHFIKAVDVIKEIAYELQFIYDNKYLLCKAQNVFREIVRKYSSDKFKVRYGIFVCTDALKILGSRVVENEDEYKKFRDIVEKAIRAMSEETAPVVLACDNYKIYDVYSYFKSHPELAKYINSIEVIVC